MKWIICFCESPNIGFWQLFTRKHPKFSHVFAVQYFPELKRWVKLEFATQGFNFIATIESILDCGASPIIAPIDENLNMDLEQTSNLITKKTKAIIIVHMLGCPGDMNAFKKLSKFLPNNVQ